MKNLIMLALLLGTQVTLAETLSPEKASGLVKQLRSLTKAHDFECISSTGYGVMGSDLTLSNKIIEANIDANVVSLKTVISDFNVDYVYILNSDLSQIKRILIRSSRAEKDHEKRGGEKKIEVLENVVCE
jgi:hypothetical protein